VVQIRSVKAIVAACCSLLFAFAAAADDFKTIDGKEYKHVTVSRVEPDGIVITFSRGIVKLSFAELSPEIPKKYGYDEERAKAFAAKVAQDQQDIYLQTEAEKERQAKIREAEARYCRDRLSSISLINSGILIGLARDGRPWMWRPVFVSGFVTSAVRKMIGVLCNSGSASICAATSPPSVAGINMSSKIASGRKFWAL
jgi:hypothetical protein